MSGMQRFSKNSKRSLLCKSGSLSTTIMQYGYEKLGLKGYELNVFSTNHRTIKCYKNVGFIEDGIGKSEDDIHMKISR